MKFMKRMIPVLLVVAIVACMAVPAFASDQYYTFKMSNTGSTAYVYTSTSNTKWYANQNATIKCGYSDAPGWGYRLCLVNSSYVESTYPLWYTSASTDHPAYYSGMGAANVTYYMCGRIDNDYYGTYLTYGYFNSDYT